MLNDGKLVFLIKLSPKAIYALYKKNVLLRNITYKKKENNREFWRDYFGSDTSFDTVSFASPKIIIVLSL